MRGNHTLKFLSLSFSLPSRFSKKQQNKNWLAQYQHYVFALIFGERPEREVLPKCTWHLSLLMPTYLGCPVHADVLIGLSFLVSTPEPVRKGLNLWVREAKREVADLKNKVEGEPSHLVAGGKEVQDLWALSLGDQQQQYVGVAWIGKRNAGDRG